MKRAALIAGVSVVTLLCAGPRRFRPHWSSELLVGHTPGRLHRSSRRRDDLQAALQSPPKAKSKRNESKNDKTPPIPSGTAAHHRLDRQAARDAVRRRRAVRKHGDFLGHREPSDADGRVHGDPEEPAPRLQSLRRADALHAAHHLVGCRAARRAPARLSGIAWLRPSDHELRATALEGDQDGRARHRHAARGYAAGVRPRPPVRAEAEDGGGTEARRAVAAWHPPIRNQRRRRLWPRSRPPMPRARQPWR